MKVMKVDFKLMKFASIKFASWEFKKLIWTLSLFSLLISMLQSPEVQAQDYSDFSDFSSDPVLLDQEANTIFGRFFQNSILVGTGIFDGDLGKAHSAGFLLGMRFVFYFDKVWGIELQAGYGQSQGIYDERNTKTTGVDVQFNTNVIPLHVGFRYGFDQSQMPRGFSTMNPYLSMGGELMYRSERIVGNPTVSGLNPELQTKYGAGAINNTNALGFNLGGGLEFDVYKNRMLLGFDIRYHFLFWPDAHVRIGDPSTTNSEAAPLERNGGFLTILGSLTYNY
jgi:opacity protein-like surface antigen